MFKTPQAPQRHRAKTGSFVTARHRKRYFILVASLIVLSLLTTMGVLTYGIPVPFGHKGFWLIVESRLSTIVVMMLVATCHAMATVSFQTATANRIVTPSILGFESLYVAIQTALVFFFGIAGAATGRGLVPFILQMVLMVGLASLLYGWLLSGRFSNVHIMLLVGVVIGGGLSSLSAFMQRMLDPNEFDVLSARTFGNLANANTDFLPVVIPLVIVVAFLLLRRANRLNVLSLGKPVAENLGLVHRHEVMKTLLLVSILMAVTTSLVGPMTFLGFLIAAMAYSFTDTYDHKRIFPVAILLGYVVLTGAYFVLRNIFYAQGAVTVIIEMIGGLVFLVVIMRKGRL
ncbi:iron chelate uptake ABC transporter family permease subunit [Auritidibacter ignavus]|uniref:iron chelate uptake ABC transporter family permease subunit n=1 Tax=Auritidibacter ignavus TaxID=678932 RepID=UPI00244A1ACD|nr:iron chelate uptake ABC transporter family permease subunit [Auritidibacter ignavus]WGH83847.1 iron chelate uptake ABC transporter family permease subunit [Auritidibacter ignavus]